MRRFHKYKVNSGLIFAILICFISQGLTQDLPAVQRLGKLYNFWFQAYDITVQDDIAYVATSMSGVQIIDVSRPEEPVRLGYYDNFGGPVFTANISGDILVVSTTRHIWVLNVSDPSNPEITGEYLPEGYRSDIFLEGSLMYIATWDGIDIVDISDPSRPVRSRFWEDDMADSFYLHVRNDTAYTVTSGMNGNALKIVDMSSPDSFHVNSVVQFENNPHSFHIQDDMAFIITGNFWEPGVNRLEIIDVSDVNEPEITSTFEFEEMEEWQVKRMAGDGRYLYVTSSDAGLVVIDLVDPYNPAVLVRLDLPFECYGIYSDDEYIYCAASFNHLKILDIREPDNPRIGGSFETGIVNSVDLAGSMAVLGTGKDGVRLVDVSDPRNPAEILHWEEEDSVAGVSISGGYLFVSLDSSGVLLLDVGDPDDVQEISRIDTPGSAKFSTI